MAHVKSAKKRIRQTVKRTENNNARTSRIRTFVKKVELAVSSGNKEDAAKALRDADSEMQRGTNKGLFHKNTVARKISRLSKRIKAL